MGSNAGDIIPDSYIVVLKQSTSESTFEAHKEWVSNTFLLPPGSGGTETTSEPYDYVYDCPDFKGYCGTFSKAQIDEIASHKDVEYIEPNRVVSPPPDETPTEVEIDYVDPETTMTTETIDVATMPEVDSMEGTEITEGGGDTEDTETTAKATVATAQMTIQSPIPSWGLGAISHRSASANRYVFHQSAGHGTTVFVLDTGIRITHRDFGGRARRGHNFVSGSQNTDVHGHGTHVSGTAVGSLYGVAKRATVVDVKVLGDNGYGSIAGIIAGVDWVVRQPHRDRAVMNISIQSDFSNAFNNAIRSAYRAGVFSVVCAGNKNIDASSVSPASAQHAYTIGSIAQNRRRASDSNFGRSLNMFGPGVNIRSCGHKSDTATAVMSGTSMATPHVAGVAVNLIAIGGLQNPAAIWNRLRQLATHSIVIGAGLNSPNLFLYNGSGV